VANFPLATYPNLAIPFLQTSNPVTVSSLFAIFGQD
jgi:hypothetical protein